MPNIIQKLIPTKPRCQCGKRRRCPQKIWVADAGVLQQDSNALIKCDIAQSQLRRASEVLRRSTSRRLLEATRG